MIVNPQLFNYRLIIGSLIVTVAAISAVGFFSYQSLESERAFLESENQLIRKELDNALIQYDEVTGINNELKQQIENSEQLFQFAIDSLTSLPEEQVSASDNSSTQITTVLRQNSYLQGIIDSLKEENSSLTTNNQTLEASLEDSQSTNATLSKELLKVKELKNLPVVAMLNSLEVTPYRVASGKKLITIKANSASLFEVCLKLVNTNEITLAGDLFVQILDPNNNVVADKGAMNFGNASLIYSGRYNLKNLGNDNEVCLDIITDNNDRPLKKGTYRVNVFHNDTMLENTTVLLN
ncbi:hypothetical protein [Aegicerativicinus sediminis]|uniref:hypothetical protein n=1 Tax=Aegicerativicinus sediminis TaxID=2893202 RepID=UPI001E2DF124|nr:hypothetical protein [Aegicerativicinus sediminis]